MLCINNVSFHLTWKKEQKKPKASRRKELINVREKIKFFLKAGEKNQ